MIMEEDTTIKAQAEEKSSDGNEEKSPNMLGRFTQPHTHAHGKQR